MSAVLRLEDVSVAYPGSGDAAHALHRVSLDVLAGSVVAVLGESGSGKSTLAMAAANLGLPSKLMSGTVRLNGTGPGVAGSGWRGSVGFVFQDCRSSFDPLYRIGRQLAEVRKVAASDTSNSDREAAVIRTLEEVGLTRAEDIVAAYPHQLSGGMLQRVGIAAALLADAKVLVADEPTSALDAQSRLQVLSVFRQLSRDVALPTLWITHDIDAANVFADYVVILRDGVVVERGETAQVFSKPQAEYTRELLRACPSEDPTWVSAVRVPSTSAGTSSGLAAALPTASAGSGRAP